MTVRLIRIDDKPLSLEFDLADIDWVEATIKNKYGKLSKKRAGIATIYKFGGCNFTFQNEWEDPCLITDTAKGSEILKDLNRALSS